MEAYDGITYMFTHVIQDSDDKEAYQCMVSIHAYHILFSLRYENKKNWAPLMLKLSYIRMARIYFLWNFPLSVI